MRYNKKQQPFEILGRFRILEKEGEVEYCRIKFHNTGHEANIPNGLVKTENFEDMSILEKEDIKVEETHLETIVIKDDASSMTDIVSKINMSPSNIVIDANEISLNGIVVASPPTIIATNPDGEEISILTSIEDFCELYKLDVEAVELVLAGKQKTHKKWRFTR